LLFDISRVSRWIFTGKAPRGRTALVDADAGMVHWRLHAAPSSRTAIGFGRLSSVWPIWASPVASGGKIYLVADYIPTFGAQNNKDAKPPGLASIVPSRISFYNCTAGTFAPATQSGVEFVNCLAGPGGKGFHDARYPEPGITIRCVSTDETATCWDCGDGYEGNAAGQVVKYVDAAGGGIGVCCPVTAAPMTAAGLRSAPTLKGKAAPVRPSTPVLTQLASVDRSQPSSPEINARGLGKAARLRRRGTLICRLRP